MILTGKGMKATTLMSMTPTGTITAHSRIEALPTPSKKPKSPVHEPTAPAHHSPKNQKSGHFSTHLRLLDFNQD